MSCLFIWYGFFHQKQSYWIINKEICSNILFCFNLGLLALSFIVLNEYIQLNGKTLQVLKISFVMKSS